jgi:hypothetical protein
MRGRNHQRARTAVLAGSCVVLAVMKLSDVRDVEPAAAGSVVAQVLPTLS